MNVTFLIGNGFDINLGLKTQYTDFYDTYIESNKDRDETDSIKKFTNLIEPTYETWADFEMAFAEHVFGTANDVKNILADFSEKFADYLSKQITKCNYKNETAIQNFRDFLIHGYKSLETRDRQLIERLYAETNEINLNFINFNYTDTLDNLINLYAKRYSMEVRGIVSNYSIHRVHLIEPFNIHGTLKNNTVVMGIDSIDQFKDENLKKDENLRKYCVKSAMNEYIGNKSLEDDFVNIVNVSEIIYAYGISFGKSDRSRWNLIIKWLKSDINNKLVIYKYKTDFKQSQSVYKPKLLDAINRTKKQYLQMFGFDESDYEAYYDQIFVIDSDDVLNFKLINDETPNGEGSLEVHTA